MLSCTSYKVNTTDLNFKAAAATSTTALVTIAAPSLQWNSQLLARIELQLEQIGDAGAEAHISS